MMQAVAAAHNMQQAATLRKGSCSCWTAGLHCLSGVVLTRPTTPDAACTVCRYFDFNSPWSELDR